MRRVSQGFIVALVFALLTFGLTACGGDGDDSGSTATEPAAQAPAQSDPKGDTGAGGAPTSGGEDDSGSGEAEGGSGNSSADFTPKQHDDSGGGSEQFRVKGGDNSVQEFGEEDTTEEFDAAAAVLHNFLDARAEGNAAAACDYLSESIVDSFAKLAAQTEQADTSCGGMLEALTNPAAKQMLKEEAAKADVRSLRINGIRSFVIYTGIDEAVLAMPMANEDGEWKITALAGIPLS